MLNQIRYRFLFFAVFVTILLLTPHSSSAKTPEVKEFNVLALSDIHFDPLLNCPKSGTCKTFEMLKNQDENNWKNIFENYSNPINSKYGQDTNYSLLKDMLFANKNSINHLAKNANISFVVVNGDFIAHSLKRHYYNLNNNSYVGYSDFIKKIMKFVADQIQLSLSLTTKPIVFPVLGNNDSYIDDYYVDDSDSAFYFDTAKSWQELFPKIDQTAFTHRGFYSNQVKTLNTKIVVLNSNLFSIRAKSSDKNKLNTDANEQLKWLSDELNDAQVKNQKVILAFHIPATIDPYSSSVIKTALMFWKSEYQKIFLQIIKDHKNEVLAIFNSHIHSDVSFVYSSDEKGDVQLFSSLIPSISPVHANNPGFKIFHFANDRTSSQSELKNIDTYFYDIATKISDKGNAQENTIEMEYNFDQVYKSEDVRGAVNNLIKGDLNQDYFGYYNLGANVVALDQQKYYSCAMKFAIQSDYNSCIK